MSWESFGSAVLGASVTQSVTFFLTRRKEKAAKGYLVALISVRLEHYAGECEALATDRAPFADAIDIINKPVTRARIPTLTLDSSAVDWSTLEPAMLRDLLRIPTRSLALQRSVGEIDRTTVATDIRDYVGATLKRLYAEMGIDACDVASQLRKLAKLPASGVGYSDARPRLIEILRKLQNEEQFYLEKLQSRGVNREGIEALRILPAGSTWWLPTALTPP